MLRALRGLGLTAAIASGASLALRLLSRELTIRLGARLGRLVHYVCPWRLAIVHANLRRAGFAATLDCAAYEHLGRALLLTLKPDAPHSTRVADPHALAQLKADCHAGGVIVCSAHIGTWEAVPAALAQHVPERARRHCTIVYRPLHDAALDRWLRRRRESSSGVALVPDDPGSIATLRRALQRGGVAGLLPDQRPAAGRTSVPVRSMLGAPCALSIGACALHASTGCPVWFVALTLSDDRDEDGADGSSRPAAVLTLTRLAARGACEGGEALANAYAAALDAAVRRWPAQYFWWHDRWSFRGARPPTTGWWRRPRGRTLVCALLAFSLTARLFAKGNHM